MKYLLLLLLGIPVFGQQQSVTVSATSPIGNSCGVGSAQFGVYLGTPWSCQSGTITAISSGGGATNTVIAYGAVANMVMRLDGVCNTSTTFTSTTGTFVTGDTGKYMEIVGCNANGATWHGTITYVSPTQVTLSVAATASATALKYAYGTAANAAFQSCADGVGAYGTCLVPAPTVCPTFASCGYIFNNTDAQTAHDPGTVKIRFNGITFQGTGDGRVHIACSGWPALYTNSTSHPSTTAMIRGNCFSVGDQDGPLGVNGELLRDITIANLHLDGMTTGNTFQGDFDPTQPTCTTTFDCWDITNKAINVLGGSGVNNIVIKNVWAHNFKGEIGFSGGNMGRARLVNVDFGGTNADDVSWSADDFELTGSTLSDAWNAGVENGIFSTTTHHLYRDNTIFNMWGQGIVLPGVDTSANTGPLEILNNTFNQIATQSGHNGSTALTAIYTIGQIGTCSGSDCIAPANLIVRGNTCTDCFSFATTGTTGHAEYVNNTFCLATAGLFNVFTFYNSPMNDVVIDGNHGCITAAAISASHALTTVYLFNPGFGTQAWTGLKISNNQWNFTGSTTTAYQFTISSGSGFAAVTSKYPSFLNESCLGCTYPNTDNGQQNLATSATIKPVGPEIHVFDASPVTATIDASKSEDGAQVKIVNTGSTNVTLANDSNMFLAASVVLAANQAVTMAYQSVLGKFVKVF